MADTPLLRPDVLVLASGGTLGEAWMSGVLAGIEDSTGQDFRDTESLVGTSAGALVAAALVAGERPRRPRPAVERLGLPQGEAAGDVASESSRRLATQWLPIPRTVVQGVAREAVRLAG
ncbi:MAG: patatin-like phospholipase family protein, partial [Solirubrobacteraceae bacterium]|nr:patatin-like phospholipase family protein [Solirubrobacteraceae bacterium]